MQWCTKKREEESQTNKGEKVRAKIYKQNYMHTFTTRAPKKKG